jgi:hypothetical protein
MKLNTSVRLTPLIFAILFSCQRKAPEATQAGHSFSPDMRLIAEKLMERSKVQPGERVLIIGQPGEFDSLVLLLEEKLTAGGAVYLGTLSVDASSWPDPWKTSFTNTTVGKGLPELTLLFSDVDLGIMLPGAAPDHAPYAAMQNVLKMGKGRTIHFHWVGAYDLATHPIPVDSAVSKVYQRALLDTDYEALSAIMEKFETAVRTNDVTITTPAGTNLHFKVGDRPVTKQDGDATLARTQRARNLIDREIELPAGAIRVAPLEESVNGSIAFPDATWNNQPVTGLVLTFTGGKVTDVKAATGAEAVKAELDQAGEAGYSFRELALGFNPLLAIPSDKAWIPYYGYGAGVVRLSLGDNTELGGKVTGGYVRWNLFADATVSVGEDKWVVDGKLMK